MLQPDQRVTVSPLIVPEIVTLPAEVDAITGRHLGATLIAAFRPEVAVVIADMSRTVSCDSSCADHLLSAHRHAVARDAELRIVPSRAVLAALRLAGADRALLVCPTMTAALTGAPRSGIVPAPLPAIPEAAQDQVQLCSAGWLAIVTTPAEVGSVNGQQFWEALADACSSHTVTIADMTGTAVCGRDVLTALLMALRCSDAGGGQLWLAVSAEVGRVIGATAIGGFFPTFRRLSDALASLPVRRPDLI